MRSAVRHLNARGGARRRHVPCRSFRIALLRGDSVEHAQQLVPHAFTAAVDEPLALDLLVSRA
jgi:hypothetical protein